LLLDEPTANLDVRYQLKVLGTVRALVDAGLAAIGAVHDLTLAARFCDRLVLMANGRVLAEGTPDAVLTPDNIASVFGVRAAVYRDAITQTLAVTLLAPTGRPIVRRLRPIVHIVCGGGTGGRLMQELHLNGFRVTACPLGAGDTDRVAADALGIEFTPVPPISPIDADAQSRHLEMVSAADIVVLCPTPFGTNNLPNLEAARYARRLVSIEAGSFDERDFTGGEARLLYNGMRPVARVATVDQAIAFCLKETASFDISATAHDGSSQSRSGTAQIAGRG
ncbi:MAG: vitamin B12 ABC transporter ATP-binding protein BtuD, partial [Chloroflexi bacterium]|nr:vitamin B12 ABC transporter ATP-binding protein BtuD [Chloroflexota bacterium]